MTVLYRKIPKSRVSLQRTVRPKLSTKKCYIKQKCQLQMGIVKYENAATPLSTLGINNTHQHFQMRYITLFQLKGLKSYKPSKFKCLDFLRKKEFMFLLWIRTLEPLKLKQSFIPHMKVLTCGINSSGAQLHGCIFTLHYTHLKLTLLLHKTVLVTQHFFQSAL